LCGLCLRKRSKQEKGMPVERNDVMYHFYFELTIITESLVFNKNLKAKIVLRFFYSHLIKTISDE